MRFSCDSCGAQYMISDDKVGPGGVKVRCKRCGQVVLVKLAPAQVPVVEPAPEAPAATPPAPSEEAARSGETGLDAELGQAFENVFGGGSLAEPGGPEGEPSAEGKTEIFPPPPAAPAAAPPAEVEWYAAIDDAQVGPLLAAGLKARWEAGEVGPDTLVWSAGMADWTALSNVPELAQALAPVPRPQPRGAAPRAPEPAPETARAPATEAAPAPASETGWKPTGASALAALASEELQAMARPEPQAATPAPGSIVDRMGLPEGGVDPTGMIPLHLRGVETTGETLLNARPPREEREKRESTEVRELRKSSSRNLWMAVVATAVAIGGAGAWVLSEYVMQPKPAPAAAAPAPAPAPVAAAVPAPVPAVAPAPAQAAAATGTSAAPAAAAPTPTPPTTSTSTATGTTPTAAPAAAPTPPPAEATQAEAPPPEKPAPAKPARKEPPAKAAKPARAVAVKAKPEPKRPPERRVVEAPDPAPAPARKPAGDPLLDVGGDDDLARELSGGAAKKRSVYVPPAPGSELPDRVSDPQIIEAVLGRKPALAACVAEQKAADPSVVGTLMLRWSISPDGAVREVKNLSAEYARQPIVPCISGVVKSTRFPKSRLGREVEGFPFKF